MLLFSLGKYKMSKVEVICRRSGKTVEAMRNIADRLMSSSQEGSGFAQDVQLSLRDADQLADEEDEVPSAPGGDELEQRQSG